MGFTSALPKRIWEHKNDIVKGFTNKYQVHILFYYEAFEDKEPALKREKQLKRWRRKWKLKLIEKHNPEWKDLYDEITK